MLGLEINVMQYDDNIALLELKGEIDLHTCPELRGVLQRLCDEGCLIIIIDLEYSPYIDSAAMGVLVDAQRRIRERGGVISLLNTPPFTLRAFEITRTIRIFSNHETIGEAVLYSQCLINQSSQL